MKSFLLLLCMSFFALTVSAKGEINTEDHAAGLYSMEEASMTSSMTKAELKAAKKAEKKALKMEKKRYKMEKRAAWFTKVLEKKMAKRAIGGLDDPIDKFLWFAIIAFIAGIIFSFFLWPVALILYIGSLVLLVIWILKKYG